MESDSELYIFSLIYCSFLLTQFSLFSTIKVKTVFIETSVYTTM